jgi:hypothetical protein
MKIKAYLTIVVSLSLLLGGVYGRSQDISVPLSGRALFSFDDNYYTLQTDRYFFRLSKKEMDQELSRQIEKSVFSGKRISITVPSIHIRHAWPAIYSGTNLSNRESFENIKKNMVTIEKIEPGFTQINGKLLLSFDEPYYLVQIDETIMKITKSDLSPDQQSEISKVNIGSEISFSVPTKAVNMTWLFKPDKQRNIASFVENLDALERNQTFAKIKGTVLYSANEASVIVQSQSLFFQLNKLGISTRTPQALEVIGSKIQLVVPNDKIEFIWSIPKAE